MEFEVAADFARQNNIAYIETSVMRKSNIKVNVFFIFIPGPELLIIFQEAFVELVKNSTQ